MLLFIDIVLIQIAILLFFLFITITFILFDEIVQYILVFGLLTQIDLFLFETDFAIDKFLAIFDFGNNIISTFDILIILSLIILFLFLFFFQFGILPSTLTGKILLQLAMKTNPFLITFILIFQIDIFFDLVVNIMELWLMLVLIAETTFKIITMG